MGTRTENQAYVMTETTPRHGTSRHDTRQRLIALIEEDPSDDYFDARVSVLSEMIRHHVKEEEKPGGMFAEARKSGMDLTALAAELEARKSELEADGSLLARARRLFEAA